MSNIEITGHVTTWEACKYILKFRFIIIRNICRGVDKLVCSHPWICVLLTIAISVIVSYTQIGKARAERDSYNKKNVQLTEKVSSYEAVFLK